eukprot:jgi/Bigna1/140589/aug1.57_g15297
MGRIGGNVDTFIRKPPENSVEEALMAVEHTRNGLGNKEIEEILSHVVRPPCESPPSSMVPSGHLGWFPCLPHSHVRQHVRFLRQPWVADDGRNSRSATQRDGKDGGSRVLICVHVEEGLVARCLTFYLRLTSIAEQPGSTSQVPLSLGDLENGLLGGWMGVGVDVHLTSTNGIGRRFRPNFYDVLVMEKTLLDTMALSFKTHSI